MAGRFGGRQRARRLACGAALATALAFAAPAAAKDCSELAGLKLDHGKVTSAELVAAGGFKAPPSPFGPPPGVTGSPFDRLPAFCRLQVTLTPTPDSDIKVEVWLPANGWNGKYVGLGNGVWAGQLSISEIPKPLSKGYVVATTDTGHTGTGMTGEFAVGHPEKLVDYGYRAIHLTAVTAKAAAAAFYGKPVAKSYWTSCSTGGRQGLMEAYRYPNDYDFISAMAPANPMTDLMTQSMFAGFWPAPPTGQQLTVPLLTLIHRAVVKECDKLDGTVDGLIANPEACHYDPVVLQCKPGQTEGCLSAGQVAVARAIYHGVRDPKGAQVLPGWPRGSELQLAMLVSGKEPFPVALTYYKLLVHGGDPKWDWHTMNFPREVGIARQFGANILNIPSNGLGPFFARGGRLLMSHGWADGLIPASNSVKFYRGLLRAVPAREARNQLRLFMVPGMNHCGGGEGATDWDPLGVLEAWDASGTPPERIVATRGGPGAGGGIPGGPPGPPLPPISRPLCTYPLIPTYKGSGNQDDAANFTCAKAPV